MSFSDASVENAGWKRELAAAIGGTQCNGKNDYIINSGTLAWPTGDDSERKIEVTTFHSLARRIIEKYDKSWWNENKGNEADEFWNLDIPVKLEECLAFENERYDALIIDEGQDFKELWFEFDLFTN